MPTINLPRGGGWSRDEGPERFRAELRATAEAFFASMNVVPDDGARNALESIITGAANLVEEETGNFDEETTRAAEVRLVTVLLSASLTETFGVAEVQPQRLQDFLATPSSLNAESLTDALRGLCPIWPFCKERIEQ